MILIDDIKYIYENELIPLCIKIKESYDNDSNVTEEELDELKKIVNKCVPGITCSGIIYTNNTDHVLFGVKVNPIIPAELMIKFLLDVNENRYINVYNMELDSKLIYALTGEQIAAYIIEEVYSIMDKSAVETVKDYLAELIALKDGDIHLRNSINYTDILTFAFKSVLTNVASLLYKDREAIGMLEVPNQLEIKDTLYSCIENLNLNVYENDGNETAPNLGVLQWALMVYEDIKLNIKYARTTLNDALMTTGSVLEKRLITDTLKSLQRAFDEVLTESARLEDNYLQELSLFRSLKAQGLKSIEADLYEFKLQAKNCVEQEEALFIIRQINTRIGIIEDYIATENLSEAEKAKWTAVDMEYRELRQELAKKKLSMRKNIGYYVDYDKLDQIEG